MAINLVSNTYKFPNNARGRFGPFIKYSGGNEVALYCVLQSKAYSTPIDPMHPEKPAWYGVDVFKSTDGGMNWTDLGQIAETSAWVDNGITNIDTYGIGGLNPDYRVAGFDCTYDTFRYIYILVNISSISITIPGDLNYSAKLIRFDTQTDTWLDLGRIGSAWSYPHILWRYNNAISVNLGYTLQGHCRMAYNRFTGIVYICHPISYSEVSGSEPAAFRRYDRVGCTAWNTGSQTWSYSPFGASPIENFPLTDQIPGTVLPGGASGSEVLYTTAYINPDDNPLLYGYWVKQFKNEVPLTPVPNKLFASRMPMGSVSHPDTLGNAVTFPFGDNLNIVLYAGALQYTASDPQVSLLVLGNRDNQLASFRIIQLSLRDTLIPPLDISSLKFTNLDIALDPTSNPSQAWIIAFSDGPRIKALHFSFSDPDAHNYNFLSNTLLDISNIAPFTGLSVIHNVNVIPKSRLGDSKPLRLHTLFSVDDPVNGGLVYYSLLDYNYTLCSCPDTTPKKNFAY